MADWTSALTENERAILAVHHHDWQVRELAESLAHARQENGRLQTAMVAAERSLIAERKQNKLLQQDVTALRAALEAVPDPEEQGFCPCNNEQLELIDTGTAHKWQHLPHCWYAKVQAALGGVQ